MLSRAQVSAVVGLLICGCKGRCNFQHLDCEKLDQMGSILILSLTFRESSLISRERNFQESSVCRKLSIFGTQNYTFYT